MTKPAKPTVVSDTQGEKDMRPSRVYAREALAAELAEEDFPDTQGCAHALDQEVANTLVALKAWLRRYQQQDFITSINHLEVERAGLYQAIKFTEDRLKTIESYALEAQKTPITREDMHDPMKAQAIFDEREGLIRLILSETGGSK